MSKQSNRYRRVIHRRTLREALDIREYTRELQTGTYERVSR